MHLQIDHEDIAHRPELVKSLAFFLLHSIGEIPDDETVPSGTSDPKAPAAPSAVIVAATVTSVAPVAANAATTPITSAPDTVSNIVNFPVPPPPPSVNTAATVIVPASAAPSATAAAAGTVVSAEPVEYDSAGMAWDARIHNKSKTKKKDGTWKLRKLMNSTPAQEAEFAALVQAVTQELAARKIATPASPSISPLPSAAATFVPGVSTGVGVAVPPPPPVAGAVPPPPATVAQPVFLPETNNAGQQNSVSVPPVPSAAPAETVPAPNGPVAGVVPAPPVAPAGPVGVTYRTIVDKATEGTRQQKLTAAQFIQLVQSSGCPNLQQLNQMPQVWADVDAKLELALAGLT